MLTRVGGRGWRRRQGDLRRGIVTRRGFLPRANLVLTEIRLTIDQARFVHRIRETDLKRRMAFKTQDFQEPLGPAITTAVPAFSTDALRIPRKFSILRFIMRTRLLLPVSTLKFRRVHLWYY